VVKPTGETRPGWKVLRVLGNLLGLPGFDFETADDVRAEALGDPGTMAQRLDNGAALPDAASLAVPTHGLQRLADVPIYCTDATVRRAVSLQLTADARGPVVGLPSGLWQQLALQPGARVRITQGEGSATLAAREDAGLADGCVRIAAGHQSTGTLGAMFGAVTVERA